MPKTGELIRRICKAGCVPVRHGASHDIWQNPANEKTSSVPRHAGEINKYTYKGILRDLGLEE